MVNISVAWSALQEGGLEMKISYHLLSLSRKN